jgi:hypothetical protein
VCLWVLTVIVNKRTGQAAGDVDPANLGGGGPVN